jgi:hypothetical protein
MILITLSYMCNLKGNKYLGNVKGCSQERAGAMVHMLEKWNVGWHCFEFSNLRGHQ